MPFAAIRALARVELRRSWRTFVALGLLAGITGACVLGALSLARRTDTAPDRLRAAVHLDDARVLVYGPEGPAVAARLAELPVVRASWRTSMMVAEISGGSLTYAGISAGPPAPADLFTPVVLRGRAPVANDEVAVSEILAGPRHVDVGSTLDAHLLSAQDVASFDTGFGTPHGPKVRLRVTAIIRMPSLGQGLSGVYGSPAFDKSYGRWSAGSVVLMRLRPGAGARAELQREVDTLAKTFVVPKDAAELGPLTPIFPDADNPKVRAAARVLLGGLLVFAAVAAVAGLLGTAQGLARHHAAGSAEQRVEAALGLTAAERSLARVLPALLGAVVAAVTAVAGGLATASVQPLGGLRQYEPHPGWAPNLALLLAGGLVVGAAFVLTAALTAWRAGLRRDATPAASTSVPVRLAAAARRPAILAGLAFAANRGRGRGAVPVGATLAGAVLGIAGVVAAATFSVGLSQLDTQPHRYGWYADFLVVDAKPQQLAMLQRDPRVRDADWISQSQVRIGSAFRAAYAHRPEKGALPWTVLGGRLPRSPDEIAIGPALLDRLRLDVGDRVTVTDGKGQAHRLRVVGSVLVPGYEQDDLGMSVMLSEAGLQAVQASPPSAAILVRARPGQAGPMQAELGRTIELQGRTTPSEIRNVTDLGSLPADLALLLAAVGAAALGHGLLTTTRRRARDLAVLRALGFTPRQVAGAVLTMAAGTAAAGLLLGVPLGFGIGRVVWSEVASATHVAGDVPLPETVVLLLVPAALLVAAALALLPALRSARLQPAAALRVE